MMNDMHMFLFFKLTGSTLFTILKLYANYPEAQVEPSSLGILTLRELRSSFLGKKVTLQLASQCPCYPEGQPHSLLQ